MILENKYLCDKCGAVPNQINSLTSIFQNPYDNLGVVHLCDNCKDDFKKMFNKFLKTKNLINKQGWKSIKVL